MKDKTTWILRGVFIALTPVVFFALNYLFFDFLVEHSNDRSEYFLYGIAISILIAFGTAVLSIIIYSITGWDKDKTSDRGGEAVRGLLIFLVVPFIYFSISNFVVSFSVDMVKVNHINLKGLCGESLKAERFIGARNQELVVRSANQASAEMVDISIVVKADIVKRRLDREWDSAKNLCLWNQNNKEVFIEDVIVKTPFGVKRHYGELFIAAPK